MIDPCEGGRLYERDEQGRELDWGRVRVWEPPRTEVEVVFGEAAGSTRVSFEHRGFEVHGRAGMELCELLGTGDGWPEVLARYERAAA